MYQDGLDDLAPASFRGVPFLVQTDKESYARRIVTHEYPMRDNPYHEDLGEKFQDFTVNGYVASSISQIEKEAIVAACRQRGNGLLQLPAKAAFIAVCLSCTVQRSLDKQGYFDIVMNFHADDGGASYQAPVAIFEQLISSVAIDAVGAFTLAYDTEFNAFGVLPYVVTSLVGTLQDFSDAVVTAVESTPLIGSSSAAAAVIRDAIGLFSGAPTYVQPLGYGTFNGNNTVLRYNGYGVLTGDTGGAPATVADVLSGNYSGLATSIALSGSGPTVATAALTIGSYSPSQPLTNPLASAVVGVIAGILDAMSSLFAPADAMGVMDQLGDFSSGETVAQPASPLTVFQVGLNTGSAPSISDQRLQDNATLINGTIRAFALMQYGRAVAATEFTNRSDAVQARADVVEKLNAQIEVAFDENTALALTEARDLAVKSLNTRLTTLSDKQTISANVGMPSLFWAYRLYADADRAQQIIDLNDVPAPAFMPTVFEALVD